MIPRVYAHSQNAEKDICKADTYIRVKDIERIKELTKEFEKYGLVFEEESPIDLETKLHLIVKIPYKAEVLRK